MSGARRRAKTATVAFPVLSGTGTHDLKLHDAFLNNSSMTDYPFLHRTVFTPIEKQIRYATLPNHKNDQGILKSTTHSDSSTTKSTSNLFSLPPPPPLNPKLKFLKTLLNSKNTNAASKQRLPVDKETMEGSTVLESVTPATPTLPLKLRTMKTKNSNVVTPKTARKIMPTSKLNTESGTTTSENLIEPLLPSLQLCPAPGTKNIIESQTEEYAYLTGKQLYRTEEEQDENPESIYLDKKGFKQFPFLGSDESNLKLVSLQHNFICRLENLPSLNHLLVLDLYNNRVERITGLQVFHSLRVLLLGKNRIRRIEGLDGLKRLEILDLHGNQLRYIDNLTSLTSLRVLNLAGNLIRSIRNLGPYGLSALMELNLKRNRIKNLDGLQRAPHIRKLLLANNELQSISALFPLRKMLFLQELLLESNPVCSLPEYTSQIVTIFPWLTTLDKTLITDQMKLNAKVWHRRRIAQDEEKRKEQEKLRLTAVSTREEIIHEARRRWESVKKFVKHSNNGGENHDTKLAQIIKSPKGMRGTQELRRAKSETRSGSYDEHLSPLRFPISASIPSQADTHPLPLINAKTAYFRREESIVTTLTKTISLKPRDHENTVRNAVTMLPGNTTVESQSHSCEDMEIKKIFSSSPVAENIHKEYVVEPVLLKKLMKVAVVRPLRRVLHPELPIESLDETNSNLSRTVHIPFTCDIQLPSAPNLSEINQPTEIKPIATDLKTAPPAVEDNPVVFTHPDPEPENMSNLTNASECLEILNIEKPALIEAPVEEPIASETAEAQPIVESNFSKSEIVEFADGIAIVVPDTLTNPTLAKRPVFGRSASTCILSAVPTALTATNSSSGSSSATSSNINISGIKPNEVETVEKYLFGTSSRVRQDSTKMKLDPRSVRSSSVDAQLPTSDSDTFDVESTATSIIPASDVGTRKTISRSLFPRKGRLRRGQTARAQSTTSALVSLRRPVTGVRDRRIGSSPLGSGRSLRRRDSVAAIESPTSNVVKKQGTDYLVEIDGKVLSLYGQGALKHMLTGFAANLTSSVNTVKFHFISFDTIIPHFGKLRQTYPALEHVQFRANNITVLAQLNALADLQGLSSLQISKEGNSLLESEIWQHYAIYRLAHWGLQQINGKEIPSEYRGGTVTEECKVFESLGYLALSCLPQSALTPLAKKLHTLHCFCCCSPSTSSDESGKRKTESNGDGESYGNICTSWDDDPVLLDVIGKESLVYIPPKEEHDKTKEHTREVGARIVTTGRDMIDKLDLLDSTWSSLMIEVVEDILIDYLCMDNYMKKELRKIRDMSLLAGNSKKSKS